MDVLLPTYLNTISCRIYVTIKESEKNLRCHVRTTYIAQQQQQQQNQQPQAAELEVTYIDNNSPPGVHETPTISSATPRGGGASGDNVPLTSAVSPVNCGTATSENRNNKASSLRKREVTLSRISIYIAFVFLFCHSIRIIPNSYELISTYTQVSTSILATTRNL